MVIVFLPESTRLNDVMPRPQAKAPKALTPLLEIRNLTKSFDGQHAVDDVSLTIYKGEIFALLGASGCGKSTLLRMLAGFEQPTAGQIMLDGVDLARVPPYQRPINMMFQSYALFPHMTVEQNIAFGLKQDRLPKAEITARVQEMLALVHMQEFAKRKPHQLSGGQRQRVALARSLAKRPKLLLLDEPMGALDKKLRDRMQLEVVDILERVGVTCVMVTHDQEEAMEVADRVVVMSQGNIEQADAPERVWREPSTRFVLEFMGEVNRLQGVIRGGQFHVGAHRWPLGYTPAYQGPVDLFLRPWEVDISRRTSLDSPLPVQVLEASPKGHYTQLVVQPLGWYDEPLSVVLTGDEAPSRGERLFVGLQNARLYNGTERIEPRGELALAESA